MKFSNDEPLKMRVHVLKIKENANQRVDILLSFLQLSTIPPILSIFPLSACWPLVIVTQKAVKKLRLMTKIPPKFDFSIH